MSTASKACVTVRPCSPGSTGSNVQFFVVSLEDGLGLQVVIACEAERILLRYARMATGVALDDLPMPVTSG